MSATNIAASVLAKLRNVAVTAKVDFNLIGIRYVQERLLFRMAASPYRDRFVLKGGLLLFAWNGFNARPTRDVDLLALQTANDAAEMKNIFCSICLEESADGVRFHPDTIDVEVIQESNKYSGLRVKIQATIGKTKWPVCVDIGFGDVIIPGPQVIDFPVILKFNPAPVIQAYSLETVISEKFEAMVSLGTLNSRMKDFYDIWALSQKYQFDGSLLRDAILSTARVRGTDLSRREVIFSTNFVDKTKASHWVGFLRKSRITDAPVDMRDVIAGIQGFLEPILETERNSQPFLKIWSPVKQAWVDPADVITG